MFLFFLLRIVRSYLLHYGYQDTLNSFDTASKSTLPPISVPQENGVSEQGDTYALSQRKVLRQVRAYVVFWGIDVGYIIGS